MSQVMINVPNAVLYDTHMDAAAANEFAKQRIALAFYTEMNVSIGYCAEIAGMTEEEFVMFLGKHHVDIFRSESDDELMRDVANA